MAGIAPDQADAAMAERNEVLGDLGGGLELVHPDIEHVGIYLTHGDGNDGNFLARELAQDRTRFGQRRRKHAPLHIRACEMTGRFALARLVVGAWLYDQVHAGRARSLERADEE